MDGGWVRGRLGWLDVGWCVGVGAVKGGVEVGQRAGRGANRTETVE